MSNIDQLPDRSLTFDPRGVTITIEMGHTQVHWQDVTELHVEKVGERYSALELTVSISNPSLGESVFGVLEYPCWDLIRKAIERIAPGTKISGWKKPEIPLHKDLSDLDRALRN